MLRRDFTNPAPTGTIQNSKPSRPAPRRGAAFPVQAMTKETAISDPASAGDQPQESAAAVDGPVGAPSVGGIASFSDQIFIDSGKRLPHLDQGPVKAYAASQLRDVSQATHFALLCEPHLIPRSRMASQYAGIVSSTLIRLVASGPVYWPPEKGERYVFIYEAPMNKPLTPMGQYRGLDMRSDIVENAIVRPLLLALLDMRDADMVHGNIRPSNIFISGVGNAIDRVILGDCLSTPPSYNQHVIFETIERAMCDPIAKGTPTVDHDMYALGATLAVILRSRDPMEGMSNDEIIRHKMEQGSYIALTGKDRFTGNILELLRGLLNDDRAQRWGIEEARSWLDGRRMNPKTGSKRVKAARPFHFNGERYLRPSSLAMDLHKNQAEAVQEIENGNLEQWISRSLEDPLVQKRMETALEAVAEQGRGPGYADRLLCRISIALDPEAPIRYKGLSIHPDGIGRALAAAMIRRGDVQPYVEIINQQTIMFWMTSQMDSLIDVGSMVSRFDSCRAFLRQANIAYGIERCLYFLAPECPCISDRLKGFYVRNPEDLMRAFEAISARPDRPELFLDRHIIAFLSVKDRKDVDPYLLDLNAEGLHKRISGNIKTLATIQQRSQMGDFPGICRWISEILDPVYEHYHDRELRKSLRAKVQKLVERGKISKIVAQIESGQTITSDWDMYGKARVEYHRLRVENEALSDRLANPDKFRAGIGREIAAVASCILSGVVIIFFAFMFFIKGGLG